MFVISKNLILLTICSMILHLSSAEDKCRECMSNEVYCLNQTSFYICMKGKPLESMLNTCNEGEVCTADPRICVSSDETDVTPVCSNSCNECRTNTTYTCVSQKQWGRCVNKKVAFIGNCDGDSICSLGLFDITKSICAPQCVVDFLDGSPTCSNEVATTTTTTTEAPSTPDFENLREQCKTAGETNDKQYFYTQNINDTECNTYIYCEKIQGSYDAVLMRCKEGYFDGTSKCTNEKPDFCDNSTTPPSY